MPRLSLALAAVAALVLTACTGTEPVGPTPPPAPPTVVAISLAPDSLDFAAPGQAAGLTASLTTTGGPIANPAVVWSSSDPAVATVSGSGTMATVTAITVGSATITASHGAIARSIPVRVRQPMISVSVALMGSGTGSIVSAPAGLNCVGATCTGTFVRGTTVQLTAVAGPNSQLQGWSLPCAGSAACQVRVDSATALSVRFQDTMGPLAHYPFDDCTAKDASGNGYHGALFGAPTCIDGPVGKALEFDGRQGYMQVRQLGDSARFRTSWSVSGWFKASPYYTNYGWVTLLTNGNTGSMSTPFAVMYAATGNGQLVPVTRFTDDRGNVHVRFLTKVAAKVDEWTQFTWTFERGVLRIYTNGALVESLDMGIARLATTTLPTEIGRDEPGVVEYLDGAIDDLRIHDRAIDAAEVLALYRGNRRP